MIAMDAIRRVSQFTFRWEDESPAHHHGGGRHMARAGLQEHRFIVELRGPAEGDDDTQPHIAQHPNSFRVLLPALPGMVVVRSSPRAVTHAAEGKLPKRVPQGMDAGATKVDDASVGTGAGHRRSAGFALGDGRVLIPVPIVAQFSDHPGGERGTSAGQAAVELAVRVESQYPLNLPIVRVEMRRQRLELRDQGTGQPRLRAHDGRGDMKGGALQALVNRARALTAVGAVMAAQEAFELSLGGGLQPVARGKRLEQGQRDRAGRDPQTTSGTPRSRFSSTW